jgi:perosamine synthetase
MIPRFKPELGLAELAALFDPSAGAVARFEAAFAHTFGARHALAFPYGRSALWAMLRALDLRGAEVVMPAYTCVVVAHAAVLSGNTPRFVDITLHDYNMDLDQLAAAMNERTRVVLATHLFGYPMNVDRVAEVVRDAERRFGHKIWVIQDCAHSFGATWRGAPVGNAGDAGLYALNISKMMTSVFGGVLTFTDDELAGRVRTWRDDHFGPASAQKALMRRIYLLATAAAFDERVYGVVNWLQEETPLLNTLTKAYHLDEQVRFPPDHQERMLDVEARVGLAQLRKYPEMVRRRRDNAMYYGEHLPRLPGVVQPPLVDGATYSHYVVRVPDRAAALRGAARAGVNLGELIQYSVPHLKSYARYAGGQEFPNSLLCSRVTVNLPIHPSLTRVQRAQVVEVIRSLAPVVSLPAVEQCAAGGVRRMAEADVPQVIAIHEESWRSSELSVKLGRRFLQAFYEHVVTSSHACPYVYTLGDQIVGYCVGYSDYSAFNADFSRRYRWTIGASLIKRMLVRRVTPSDLLNLLTDGRKMRAVSVRTYHLGAMALAPAFKRTRQGSQAMRAVTGAALTDLERRGAPSCWGVCDQDNHPMRGLFQRLGFDEIDVVSYSGRSVVIYEKSFAVSPQIAAEETA